jgi:hypothetical protein
MTHVLAYYNILSVKQASWMKLPPLTSNLSGCIMSAATTATLYVSCNYGLVSTDFTDISTENLLILYNYVTVCIKRWILYSFAYIYSNFYDTGFLNCSKEDACVLPQKSTAVGPVSIHGWLNDSVTVGNFVLFWPVISVFIKGLHSASKCACCLF